MRSPRGRGAAWGYALGAALPVAFVGLFFAWPLATIVGLGLAPEGAVDLAGAAEVLARPRTLRVLGQTLLLAAAATLLAAIAGIPLAFVLYRRRFRGRALLRVLVLLPFVMPSVVVGFAFRSLLREGGPLGFLGWDGTAVAVVLAMAFFNVAVFCRTVGIAAESLDPRMEDAARVLGASPLAVLRTVTLPRLLPAMGAAAAIVFLFCATSFGVVLVVGGTTVGTIETEIYLQTVQFLDLTAASVLSLLQLVIVVALLLVANLSRRRRGPERLSDVVGAVRPAVRRDIPGIAFAVLIAALLVVPILTLVVRSLDAPDGWGFGNYAALATTGERNALRISVLDALGNSIAVAVAGTAIAVALGVAASLVLSRMPRNPIGRRLIAAADHALMLPLGVSATTVGLGILITLDEPPVDLRATWIIVPVAQALVALPLIVRSLVPVLTGIDPRLREALQAMGASPWRVLRDVDLATSRRAILASTALAFAVCLGEFGATAFLSRPEQATLPVAIYRLMGTPGPANLGMAAAAAVLLALLAVGAMALVERARIGRAAAF